MKEFVSTRDHNIKTDLWGAILKGPAEDGGLFVPGFELPKLDLQRLLPLDYPAVASEVISQFAPSGVDLKGICARAYEGFPPRVVPLKKVGSSCYIAELFHGRTAAFKDMALSLLPSMMTLSAQNSGEQRHIMILVATSGDTGKAALEGFKDVPGTSIVVFYPTQGVSPVQRLQMVTQQGSNTTVVGIDGNFDDAQRAVKACFADESISRACEEHGILLSSANSINIARLLPQIVYYVWSYLELCREGDFTLGDKVNFCVPSGNFGNCLGAYLASQMGVPVGRLLVASNPNHILTDFFNSGCYDIRGREFLRTSAPAMDILVSSNIERLLWYICGEDRVRAMMQGLRDYGHYELSAEELQRVQSIFSAGYLTQDEIVNTIRECYEREGYLLDTHTACAYGYLQKYRRDSGDTTPTVVMATASPYKFPEAVLEALRGGTLLGSVTRGSNGASLPEEGFEEDGRRGSATRVAQGASRSSLGAGIERLATLTEVPIPEPLRGLEQSPILHNLTINRGDILPLVTKIISKGGTL